MEKKKKKEKEEKRGESDAAEVNGEIIEVSRAEASGPAAGKGPCPSADLGDESALRV